MTCYLCGGATYRTVCRACGPPHKLTICRRCNRVVDGEL